MKKQFSTLLHNAQNILQDDVSVIIGSMSFGVVLYLWLIFIDLELMVGNLGKTITYSQIVSHWILSIIFGIFVAATVYKIRWMSQRSRKESSSGIFGWLVSTIIIGCPACSITIASYLGLGSILFYLPGFGLEIKLLGLFVLIVATYITIRDLRKCAYRSTK